MSWSISKVVGKPDAVKRHIQREYDRYGSGQSKDEFGEALPHLLGLIDLTAGEQMQVEFSACGSASFYPKEPATPDNPTPPLVKTQGQIDVHLKPIWTVL